MVVELVCHAPSAVSDYDSFVMDAKSEVSTDNLSGASTVILAGTARERWSSRWAFQVAAVASAVGMGNLWRFPWLAYRYGGGAFFVPYFGSLIFLGLPLLILEFALGQIFQGGHPKVFNKLQRRLRGVGFGAVAAAFVCVSYYGLILCWAGVFLLNSFRKRQPWAFDSVQLAACKKISSEDSCLASGCVWTTAGSCSIDVLEKAQKFFSSSCNIENDPSRAFNGGVLGVSVYNILLMMFLWGTVYVTVNWGARIMGKILIATMLAPTILIIVLLSWGLSLEGSSIGVQSYIGTWNFNILASSTTVWTNACAQIFFSLSICMGVMTAYASHNKASQNVVQDAIVVGVANSGYSFACGFIVFSFAGYLAHSAGVPLESLRLQGTGLAFVTYPVGVGSLPFPAAQIVAVTFFATLWLLGFDTAVSNVTSAITLFTDADLPRSISRRTIAASVCGVLFVISVVYSTSIGASLLDVTDNFATNIALMFVGLCESTGAGWIQGMRDQICMVGRRAVATWMVSLFSAVFIGCVLVNTLPASSATVTGVCFFVVIVALGACLSLYFAHRDSAVDQMLHFKGKAWWLLIGNIEELRDEINRHCCSTSSWFRVPFIWSIALKYVVPCVSTFLLVGFLAESKNTYKYGGYPIGYVLFGAFWTVGVILVVVLGMGLPKWFDCLLPKHQAVDDKSID